MMMMMMMMMILIYMIRAGGVKITRSNLFDFV